MTYAFTRLYLILQLMALPKDDSFKTLNGKLVNVEGMTIGSFPETAMF